MREPTAYDNKVKGSTYHSHAPCQTHNVEYVQKYATKEAYDAAAESTDDDDEEAEMSSVDSFSDEEAAGMEL